MKIWHVAVGFTAVAVLVVGLVLHWPWWLLLVIALALAAAYLGRSLLRRPLAADPVSDPLVIQQPELRSEEVADLLLPSKDADYCFLFSTTVLWSPAGMQSEFPPASLAARAVEAVVRRASDITRQRTADSASVVRWELSTVLGEMKTDSFGCVRAMADSVRLVLPANDQERLEKIAALRKDEIIWEYERRYEQSRRRYLSVDVLKDTGSAVVWWLNRNNDEIEKAVRDIGILVQLCSAVNNTAVPVAFRHLVPDSGANEPSRAPDVGRNCRDDSEATTTSSPRPAADHFADFLAAMSFADGDPQTPLLAHQVAMAVAANGRPDIAADLVHRFDPPCDDRDDEGLEPDSESDLEQKANERGADDLF